MNVTVTDNTTGLVYNVTKRIPLYKEKIQATIISEPESYKPGMIYQIKVRVYDLFATFRSIFYRLYSLSLFMEVLMVNFCARFY